MLDIVRNLVSSIFGKILLGLMVLSFALWGVGDILTSGNSKLAAKVGNQKVTLEEFYNKFGRKVQELNLSTGRQMTLQEAHEQNIDQFIINELVYEKMVLEFANKNKIYLNDNILKNIIKDLPQFNGTDGKFSEILYKNSIKNNFSSEEEFLNELTFVYINSLLFENFKSGEFTNKKIIDLLYEHEGEERNIEFFIFKDKDIIIEISENELNEYYNDNDSNYLTEEERTIDYLTIKLDDYKKLISIPNDETRKYYNENKNQFFTEEKRSIEMARFHDKDNAENFYEVWSLNNSANTEKYIQENSVTISKIEDLSKDSFESNVTNEIFNLGKDYVSRPIKINDAGYYVVKVINISPEIQETFESVKKSIADEMSYNEAYELYDQALNYADELLLGGHNLEDVLIDLDLKTIIDSDKNIIQTSKLDEFIGSQDNKELFADAYKQNLNYISEIIINNETAYIYKISNINESYMPDFDDVRDQVKIDLENHKLEKIQEEAANQFLIKYQFKDYDEFKNYINSTQLKLIALNNIRRNDNESNFEKSTIDEIFALNKDNLLKFKDSMNNIGIIYIKDIKSPRDKISNEYYNQVLNNIKLNFDLSIENVFGDSIIEESSYEIFIQNINNIFS